MSYSLRKATSEDVPIIAHQRKGMFQDMGLADDALLKRMDAPFRAWLIDQMHAGRYQGWLAVSEGGDVIAGAGLWLIDWIPSPLSSSTRRGYILNVFTERASRRQGIARALIEAILAECRVLEVKVVTLHASDQGRPIYEALGFEPTSEMAIHP